MPEEVEPTSRADRLADLDALYREHQAFVWRTLHHFGVRGDCIDDALQEVFMVVYRKLSDFRGDTPIRSWLYGIARRVAADHRKKGARRTARLELVPHPEAPPVPDTTVDRLSASELVGQFLANLDPDKRQVFILAEIEGMTGPEIAELLDVKLNTVYARLRTARELFQKAVERQRAQEREVAGWSR